jgi:hypothetical protein
MARLPIFEWHGKEYRSEEKSADWYWALVIVAIALIVVCVLFNNVLLALVVAAAAIAAALQAAKHPRIHRFAIIESGVVIDTHLYTFESMLHFSVLEYADETMPPSLSIKTKNFLTPHLLIPLVGYDPVDVYDYIAAHVPEGNHHESGLDRIIEMMRL